MFPGGTEGSINKADGVNFRLARIFDHYLYSIDISKIIYNLYFY